MFRDKTTAVSQQVTLPEATAVSLWFRELGSPMQLDKNIGVSDYPLRQTAPDDTTQSYRFTGVLGPLILSLKNYNLLC